MTTATEAPTSKVTPAYNPPSSFRTLSPTTSTTQFQQLLTNPLASATRTNPPTTEQGSKGPMTPAGLTRPMYPNIEDCGIPNPQITRILGGTEAIPQEFPWMVSLTISSHNLYFFVASTEMNFNSSSLRPNSSIQIP